MWPSDTHHVAIVTGGSCGIGREVVRTLARRGYAVVLVYLDDQNRAEAAVDDVLAMRGTVVAVRADVGDDLDVERLFSETIAAFGRVDAVFHTTDQGSAVLERHAARHIAPGAAVVRITSLEQLPATRLD